MTQKHYHTKGESAAVIVVHYPRSTQSTLTLGDH